MGAWAQNSCADGTAVVEGSPRSRQNNHCIIARVSIEKKSAQSVKQQSLSIERLVNAMPDESVKQWEQRPIKRTISFAQQ